MAETNQFYGSLAEWWPLISPVEDYQEEALFFLGLLGGPQRPRRTLLELGSGGGSNASYFAPHFDLTLVDLSEQMLAVSRRLLPGVAHIRADMRTLRLDRVFDVVFIHDAIDYMTNEEDLRRSLTTAFVHLAPGGTAVFVPDATREIFEPDHGAGGTDGDDGRSVRFLHWTTDPDPTGTEAVTEYVFLLRHADGRVQVVHDTHQTGLFPRETWFRLLAEVGFDVHRITEDTEEDRRGRDVFVARRFDATGVSSCCGHEVPDVGRLTDPEAIPVPTCRRRR